MFISIIKTILDVLTLLILIRILLSWVSPGRTSKFTRLINKITDPIFIPLHRIIPRVGMFDFTPVIALIIIQVIYYFLPN
ncbi:MAG: YggT family protein [Dehalococcoidales bacterium]|nr:YggT family protein [Dehalococcoidales bacterium]